MRDRRAHRLGPELWNQRIEQSARDGMAALVDGVTERWFTAGYRATRRDPRSSRCAR